jgi:hypothetical protein
VAGTFDASRLRELLEQLATRLADSGCKAGIRVVGGAAIAMINDQRPVTRDIDAALVHDVARIRQVASEMATEFGLPAEWLNDSALAFVPLVGEPQWHDLIERGDVLIQIAAPGMLLAMKLRASRGRRDADDIDFLLERCGIESIDEAVTLYEHYYPQEVLPERAVARVDHWFASRQT